MKRLILSGMLLLLFIPGICMARMELGLWPMFGMQRNNKVIFANDYTGLGGTGRLGWVLDGESAVGFTLILDFNYLNFGTEHWYVPLGKTDNMYCDVYSDYRMASLCPGVSFGLQRGSVRPYFEVFGGPAHFTIRNNFTNSAGWASRSTRPRI